MKKKILVINSINYIRNTSLNKHLKKRNSLKEINYNGNFFLKNLKLLIIFFYKFDLILINWNSWSSFFIIKIISIFKKKPIIYDAYTLIYEDYVDSELKKNFFNNFLYKNIEKIIFNNCDALITDTILHHNKILNITKSKLKTKILLLNVAQKNLRLSNKINLNNIINLMHAGANRKLHNITKMIYLVYNLPPELRKKIYFTIIGKDYFKKYENLISKLKCEKNIKLIHHVKYHDYLKMIARSDICMGLLGNTEKSENIISNFIVTSANLGKVIITKNTKSAKIYLNNNDGIFLLKKPNNLNFKTFIKKYVNSTNYRIKLKNKSKSVFLRHFEINKNFKRLDLFMKKFL